MQRLLELLEEDEEEREEESEEEEQLVTLLGLSVKYELELLRNAAVVRACDNVVVIRKEVKDGMKV